MKIDIDKLKSYIKKTLKTKQPIKGIIMDKKTYRIIKKFAGNNSYLKEFNKMFKAEKIDL